MREEPIARVGYENIRSAHFQFESKQGNAFTISIGATFTTARIASAFTGFFPTISELALRNPGGFFVLAVMEKFTFARKFLSRVFVM